MPDSGDLRGVESTPRQDTQVRVFAMPPSEDASSSEIVSGFLEALTSDDPDYEIARKYLTKEASEKWRPLLSTTVLADGPDAEPDHVGGREETDNLSYSLTGAKVATVDAQQSYAAASGPYGERMHLTRDKKTKQWRIDIPPRGVVMGKSDFQRNYVSVDKYYFASNSTAGAAAQTAVVADPVYVRRNVDPLTQMVRSLLKGPTRWLSPVVRSSFPTGTALKKGYKSLAPDDRNTLTVPLNDRAAGVGATKCKEMAAQLLFTLQNLTPAVDEIELRAGGRQLCALTEGAESVAVRGSTERSDSLYLLDAKHRLVKIETATSDTTPEPVPGALGEGNVELRSVAVSRDEDSAAGVSRNGKDLYVGSMASGGSLGDPVVSSQGKSEDDRLSTPSWDPQGDLWVADRDPANPRLLMLQNGAGKPLVVKTPSGLDGRIESVRVAADGVRIALVVERGKKSSLLIGRIERSDRDGTSGEPPTVSVLEPRSATPEMEEIDAMSWAGDSRLVVVGREQGGVQTMRYVQVDGSTPETPAPAALSSVKEIAAGEDDRLPLVAYSEDGIVRLSSGSQWQKVVTDGTAPVYPG